MPHPWMRMYRYLTALGLSWRQAGFRYLLFAADLAADGLPVDHGMMGHIAQRAGSRYGRVSQALYGLRRALLGTEGGRAALGDLTEGSPDEEFLRRILAAAQSWGEDPAD